MRVKKRSPNVNGERVFIRFQLFPKIAISRSIKQAARGYERPWPQLAIKRDELPERCALHHISGLFILVATRSAIMAREVGARPRQQRAV